MSNQVERRWQIFAPLFRRQPESFLERFSATDDSVGALMSFLRSQRLAATAAALVEELGVRADLPADFGEELKSQRRSQFLLALRNLEAVRELHARFDDLGVEHLILKGPLLALTAHGGFECRNVGDIDVLVPSDEVDRVEAALLEDGFEKRYSTFAGRRLSRFFTHHFSYGDGRQMVEVHWRLVRESGVRVDMGAVWATAQRLEFRGSQLPVPATETSLLIQILATAKDLELGTLPLRSFVDTRALALALETEGHDWQAWMGRMRSQGAGRLAPVVLELMFRLLECREEFPRAAPVVEDGLRKALSRSRLDPSQPTLGLEVFGLAAGAGEQEEPVPPAPGRRLGWPGPGGRLR